MSTDLPPESKPRTADIIRPASGERFTHRLEAFSDLVFGFSLSLLAIRLDVPTSESEIFNATRWATFIITFGMICAIWLAHYRIFRHRFVAGVFEVIVNFVFLLGIAVLPYAVQTFLRFQGSRESLLLYLGDFILVFAALATLRLSALRQRRDDEDAKARLREWRGTVRQYVITAMMLVLLVGIRMRAIETDKLFSLLPAAIVAIALIMRLAVRRLPEFLNSRAG
ncbi:MAG: potassium channel family protein [Verrucomicrobiota bacterium]